MSDKNVYFYMMPRQAGAERSTGLKSEPYNYWCRTSKGERNAMLALFNALFLTKKLTFE